MSARGLLHVRLHGQIVVGTQLMAVYRSYGRKLGTGLRWSAASGCVDSDGPHSPGLLHCICWPPFSQQGIVTSCQFVYMHSCKICMADCRASLAANTAFKAINFHPDGSQLVTVGMPQPSSHIQPDHQQLGGYAGSISFGTACSTSHGSRAEVLIPAIK